MIGVLTYDAIFKNLLHVSLQEEVRDVSLALSFVGGNSTRHLPLLLTQK